MSCLLLWRSTAMNQHTLSPTWHLWISGLCNLTAVGASEKLAFHVGTVPQVCLPDKKSFHKVSECSSQSRSPPSLGPQWANLSPSVGWGRVPCPSGQPGKQLHTTAAEEEKERDALWEQHLPQRGSLKPWWCYECYHLFSVTVWSHMRSRGHLRC